MRNPIYSRSVVGQASRPANHADLLILIADDHEDSRIITRLVLESSGYRVVEAVAGDEALALAAAVRPTVVLLDIVMPGLDGWAVVRHFRSDPAMASMIIIAVTALAGSDDRAKSLMAGFDEVLTKPIHPWELVAVINRYARRGTTSVEPRLLPHSDARADARWPTSPEP